MKDIRFRLSLTVIAIVIAVFWFLVYYVIDWIRWKIL
jgi:hypothetical protein